MVGAGRVIITAARLYRYRLPLAQPLPWAGAPETAREGLLLRIETDADRYGWGEIAPLQGFSRETLDEATADAVQCLQCLGGESVPGLLDLIHEAGETSVSPYPSVQSAVAMALAMAGGMGSPKREQQALAALLTGDEAQIREDAAKAREDGYLAAKLKVGKAASVDEDIARAKAAAEVLGRAVALRFDANRAWTLEAALAFAEGVRSLAPDYVEEPLRDPEHLPDFVNRSDLPAALDESLDAELLVALEGGMLDDLEMNARRGLPGGEMGLPLVVARYFVIKPTLTGIGPRALAHLAAAHKKKHFVLSAAFESGVGIVLLAAMAAHAVPRNLPIGLDTHRWLAEDLLPGPLPIDGGALDVLRAQAMLAQIDTGRLEDVAGV